MSDNIVTIVKGRDTCLRDVDTIGTTTLSKAGTLTLLSERLPVGRVLPITAFTQADWLSGRRDIVRKIQGLAPLDARIIVRSSAHGEDACGASSAGAYLSRVTDNAEADLNAAVDDVFASYNRRVPNPLDEAFAQPFLGRVSSAGVAFTRVPKSGAAYYVIEYELGGGTNWVTSGAGNTRTFTMLHGSEIPAPVALGDVVRAIQEVESVLGDAPLDIEFAVCDGKTTILQARTLSCPTTSRSPASESVKAISARLKQLMAPHPFLLGRSGMLGVMPDWNPAEIVGTRPRQLAVSLYRHLVTDDVWARSRRRLGYRDVRNTPLIAMLGGMPYVDVRASLNSFVPASVPEHVATKLIEAEIRYLGLHPELHDKIEFRVVATCWTPSADARVSEVAPELTTDERGCVIDGLLGITKKMVDGADRMFAREERRIALLEQRVKQLEGSGIDPLARVYWLLSDCRQYGTSAFASLARMAFVGTDLLRSFAAVGIVPVQASECFTASVRTVSSEMLENLSVLPEEKFLSLYGHLRPGTYDVRVPRYDEAPDAYFGKRAALQHYKAEFHPIPSASLREMDKMLKSYGFRSNSERLLSFAARAIAAREHAKFVFSRSVSDALKCLTQIGASAGVDLEELSHVDVLTVIGAYARGFSVADALTLSSAQGRVAFEQTTCLQLPPLIVSPNDAYSSDTGSVRPNFVCRGVVEAAVASLDADELKGKIVAIPQADPGYDWIFAHGIAGFFTAYGGTNSHMAIRAAEMAVPAVIGAGEALFARWSGAGRLRVDCDAELVEVLS